MSVETLQNYRLCLKEMKRAPHWGPLKFEPLLVERVWGGEALAAHYAPQAPSLPHTGEIWILYGGLPVINGPYRGWTLDALYRKFPSLLGYYGEEENFPLLIKWLRAERWLSLQLHPDTPWAQYLSGDQRARGKDEAWLVTEVEPGAELIAGVKPGVSWEDFCRAKGPQLVELVHREHPYWGEVFYIPAGLVHALGPGISVLEVQGNSQLTYRLYDWDRPGLDGRPRQLHLEEARAVLAAKWPQGGAEGILRGSGGRNFPPLVGEELLSVERFRLELLSQNARWSTPTWEAEVIVCTKGQLSISLEGQREELICGQVALLAAGGRAVELELEAESKAARVTLPHKFELWGASLALGDGN